MRKVGYLIILLLSIDSFHGCRQKSCNNDIAGKYINNYMDAETHYIIIKNDSTYFHYYENKNDIVKSHSGTWRYYEDDCEILFSNWYSYDVLYEGERPTESFVTIYKDVIEFLPGSNSRFGFYKEK